MNKIVTLNQLEQTSRELRKQGKTIVLTGGCFDILHIGHITLLEEAKKQGDILFVFLESDETIKRLKGINRPIHSQEQRVHMVSALRSVDYIIPLPSLTTNDAYDRLVKNIQPAIIAATENDPNIAHKERQAKEVGAKVVLVNKLISYISTSSVIEILSKEL